MQTENTQTPTAISLLTLRGGTTPRIVMRSGPTPRRAASLFGVACMLAGVVACQETKKCPDGQAFDSNNNCVPITDLDASTTCAANTDCTDTPATPVCNTTTGLCVACLGDDDCTGADAAKCNTTTNTCEACTSNSHCDSVSGLGVCDDGDCVQCTAADESACGTYICLPTSNTCSDEIEQNKTPPCDSCVADSQCQTDHNCVATNYMGTANGTYCLKLQSAGCERPFSVAITAASVSGAAEVTYCGIDQSVVSCDAVRSLQNGMECSGGDAAECNADGARCETIDMIPNQCTYACTGAAVRCPTGLSCAGEYCGS